MDSINNNLNGWLIINKDLVMSSRQVVNIIKKTLNVKKIGHAGTLDPLATGVLALAVGRATKTVKYIMDGMKKYSFTIKWGISTDTQDAEGEIISKSNKVPDKIKLESILKNLVGTINQIPPKFSAIKINGERAYNLARSGKKFNLKSSISIKDFLRLYEKNDWKSFFLPIYSVLNKIKYVGK